MDTPARFRSQCEQVRFALDRGTPVDVAADQRLPDYLARVRSESLHVTATTAPPISRIAGLVAERLELEVAPEIYIRADSDVNAFAPGLAHVERPVAILNSGLVQLLTPAELAFPLGHELGHVGLGHAHAPSVSADGGLGSLRERSRKRAAEISADRIGLLACRSTALAASGMIKTTSGLPSTNLGMDVPSFIAQMDRAPGELSREWELELTHPSMPFRLWALLRFSHSDVYAELSGQGGMTVPIAHIDEEIEERLGAMGDGGLDRLEETALDRAVLWVGTEAVVAAGVPLERGLALLSGLADPDRAERALAFADRHGPEALGRKVEAARRGLSAASDDTRSRLDGTIAGLVTALREHQDARPGPVA